MSEHTPPVAGVALVATGGFAGAVSRYAVEVALSSALVATLAVNVLGSFALGVVFWGNHHGDLLSGSATLVASTGFISSFTTYSTFVLDAVTAAPTTAGLYVLGSYALGFGAAALGGRGGRQLVSPPVGQDGTGGERG